MILKISVRELRELLAAGSLPRGGVLGAVAHPVGDGKSKSTMADGSDNDVDRVGLCWSRPVYADVPPMPEGFLEGFPRDCPAAMFGRRFTEAFDGWLDAFDCVLRSLPGGDKGRRMLDMESYAVTPTDAVVRVYRLEGGLRKGDVPFHGHRVHLKPRSVLGADCGDYVDGVVSNEVDSLVRGLGDGLGFDDGQMARVRALVALEERPPLHDGPHDVTGGNADEGEANESGKEKSADEKEDEVGRLDAALWESLRVMSGSVNGLLSLVGRTREFVVNTVPVRESGKVLVIVHVKDAVADTVRSRDYEVGVGALGACGFGTYVERVVAGWTRAVVRALFCDDWTRWRERRSDGTLVMCDGSQRAETKDYEARDEEDAEESRREMAEAEREVAEDLGERPVGAGIDGMRGDEAHVQDYDFSDVEGYVGTPEGHAQKERAARGGKVVSDFLRRFGLFADWVEGESGRRLVAETTPSDDWRRVVVSVTDAGTGQLLHACDYELFDDNGARITWLTTMNLNLFCLGLSETRFQERMREEHIDVFPELEGGFMFGGDNKRYNDGGRDEDVRKEYGRVRVVAETVRGWLHALEGWLRGRTPDEAGGFMFRVFPFVDHEAGEVVRGGESVRLICRRCDTYTVFDVERRIPEGYSGTPMLRHLAVGMCAEMALALAGRLPWTDMDGFLHRGGSPDPEFNAEVLKLVDGPECEADADGKRGERKAVKIVCGPKSGYDAAAHAGCVYYAADKEEIIVNGETYGCRAFVSRREVMAHKAAGMIREWMDGLDRWAEARHKERGSAHKYGMSFSVFPSGGGIRLMCHDMDHSFGKATEYAVYDRWCPLPDGVDADATDFAVMMCAMMAGDLSFHEQWMDIEEFLRREGATPFDARVLEALEGQDNDEDEDK